LWNYSYCSFMQKESMGKPLSCSLHAYTLLLFVTGFYSLLKFNKIDLKFQYHSRSLTSFSIFLVYIPLIESYRGLVGLLLYLHNLSFYFVGRWEGVNIFKCLQCGLHYRSVVSNSSPLIILGAALKVKINKRVSTLNYM
jgi:hypothetical protein